MCNLDVFAMFSFEKDEVVVPRDSAVFSDAPSVPFEYTEEKSSELLKFARWRILIRRLMMRAGTALILKPFATCLFR